MDYMIYFDEIEKQNINLKCFFEFWNTDNDSDSSNDNDDITTNNFFVFCDSDKIKHNRNIIIIDSQLDSDDIRPFKAIGRLSKQEKKLLRQLR